MISLRTPIRCFAIIMPLLFAALISGQTIDTGIVGTVSDPGRRRNYGSQCPDYQQSNRHCADRHDRAERPI